MDISKIIIFELDDVLFPTSFMTDERNLTFLDTHIYHPGRNQLADYYNHEVKPLLRAELSELDKSATKTLQKCVNLNLKPIIICNETSPSLSILNKFTPNLAKFIETHQIELFFSSQSDSDTSEEEFGDADLYRKLLEQALFDADGLIVVQVGADTTGHYEMESLVSSKYKHDKSVQVSSILVSSASPLSEISQQIRTLSSKLPELIISMETMEPKNSHQYLKYFLLDIDI